jgi:hypothetical protein
LFTETVCEVEVGLDVPEVRVGVGVDVGVGVGVRSVSKEFSISNSFGDCVGRPYSSTYSSHISPSFTIPSKSPLTKPNQSSAPGRRHPAAQLKPGGELSRSAPSHDEWQNGPLTRTPLSDAHLFGKLTEVMLNVFRELNHNVMLF